MATTSTSVTGTGTARTPSVSAASRPATTDPTPPAPPAPGAELFNSAPGAGGRVGAGPGATGTTRKPSGDPEGFRCGSDRRRSGDLSIFSRTLYQLSYRAW